MTKNLIKYISVLSLFFVTFGVSQEVNEKYISTVVKQNIEPLMQSEAIPGMAIAVIYQGKPYYFTFGAADVAKNKLVTTQTIFEIGSVSKTFTGVLGGDSIACGKMRLEDSAVSHWQYLIGDQWKNINLLHLATYTAGGLPLQIPDTVTDEASLLKYYNEWQPEWNVGTKRLYGNTSIGLFGILTAKALGVSFEDAMNSQVLKPLNLSHTWINVPESELENYAFGYRDNKPMRVSQALLADETYGIKITVEDLAKWLQVNMKASLVEDKFLQEGINLALHRYYQIGLMYQGLGWEMYDLPLNEAMVIQNGDNKQALAPNNVIEIIPPKKNIPSSWVHKTGATNGFGAYVAFVPEKEFGIVMLANKNYPNTERIKTALKVFDALH